ncbi:MAG: FHA domain-containing protein [Clostridiales bacterium]|nr:FHA domain-containing protein [Clostridiales bacterium]
MLTLTAIAFLVIWLCGKKNARHGVPPGILMTLQVLSGDCATKSPVYLVDSLTIGRARDCTVVFRDAEVSQSHARVFLSPAGIMLEDLGSENGTFLEGVRLHQPNRLRSGDVISIGNVKFVLKF